MGDLLVRGAAARRGRLSATWALFADWCAATGRTPLPARPDTVLAFIDANPAAGSTQARRVAAINAAHDAAGLDSPGRSSVVAQLLRRLRGRPQAPGRDQTVEAAWVAISHTPLSGWPAGMFGRRDAMALLVCRVAGVSVAAAQGLTVADVAEDDGQLAIGGRDIAAGHSSTAGCAACVWGRWRLLLGMIGRIASTRQLRAALATSPAGGHCHNLPARHPAPMPDMPLFVALDRWGAAAVHPEPMSARALSGLLAAHMAGRPPVHDVQPEPEPEPEPPPAPQPPPPPTPAEIAAKRDEAKSRRRHDKQIGDDLDAMFARLEAAVDRATRQTAQILAEDDARWHHVDP